MFFRSTQASSNWATVMVLSRPGHASNILLVPQPFAILLQLVEVHTASPKRSLYEKLSRCGGSATIKL